MNELRETIARLRAPDGCPWDQEQTHQTLVHCLIDEASELIETIDKLDMPHMREELGDVLIQVLFHAQLAEEAGHFDLDDVAREVNEKLVRRHPHVFGDGSLENSDQVLKQWDEIKAEEKQQAGKTESGLFKASPPRLNALLFAESVWKQIQKKKLDGSNRIKTERIKSLTAEMTDDSLGQALFDLTAAARAKGLDPEGALRRKTDQMINDVEQHAANPTSA